MEGHCCARPVAGATARAAFITPARIVELKALPFCKWGFSRLVELCRELNVSAAHHCHMATGFLLRSILNHVPPIFDLDSFARVAAECPFAKSIKLAMVRLQGQARDGADFHLH